MALELEYLTVASVTSYGAAAGSARLLFAPSSATNAAGFHLQYETNGAEGWRRHDDFLTPREVVDRLGGEWAMYARARMPKFAVFPKDKYHALFEWPR